MKSLRVMASYGGGLGDVVFDYLTDRRAWWFKHLVEAYGARIRIISQSHNSGVEDLFRHHPYIHEHVMEPWTLPSPEASHRLHNPIDGYIPLSRIDLLQSLGVYPEPTEKPALYLNRTEQQEVMKFTSRRPVICAQPFAGLSDRDAFDSASFHRLVEELVHLNPEVRILVLGKNHERGCKYAQERLDFKHHNVVNLIDRTGIRVNYFLVANCDAYVGSHSNLIRTAWDFRKRNVCVMPTPLMENHIPQLDPKYTYGWRYPESMKAFFPFDGNQESRNFQGLDCTAIANFLIRGS